MKKLSVAASIGLIVFTLYTAAFGVFADIVQRGVFLLLVFIIIYSNELGKKETPVRRKILIVLLMLMAVIPTAYMVITNKKIAENLGAINILELIMGISMIIALLDSTRRTIGWPIVTIAIVFLLYGYFGPHFPGGLRHRGFSIPRIVSHLCMGTNGIFGIPMGTCCTLVIMFIIFGSFLDASGGSKFFMDVAIAATGKSKGGPAKAAVIASALMGTISGSAATNVVTTGTFTIPLMKRIGYQDHVAGAIEAVASTGGQIMPPVMGAAAFIMSELLGVPYGTIAVAAIIPSALYFITVFAMVHYEAVKMGLKGMENKEIPVLKTVWATNGHTLISIIVLVGMLCIGFSAMYAAFYSTLTAFVCSWIRKHTRMRGKAVLSAMLSSAKNVLTVATACACAGIIIGIVSQTGLGLKISGLIVSLSGGHLLLALVITLVALIILGMGMPTAAAYILVATLVTPALVDMGIHPLAAHMFVFYGAILSAITPPVALAAYAASGIANANPMQIAVTAMRFGIAAFIIPFFFVYQPALLCIGKPVEIALTVVTSVVGCVSLSIGMQGYFFEKIAAWLRALLIIGSLLLIYPGLLTDSVGMIMIVLGLLPQFIGRQKEKNLSGEC